MRKKLVLIALALVLAVTPVFAIGGTARDNSVGVGLNLGKNTGVGLRFGFGDFDILADIGFSIFNFNLAGDVAASWNFATIDGGRGLRFPLTIGAGVSAAYDFKTDFDLSVIFPIGIEYDFAQISNVPITVYLRFAPGFSVFKDNNVKIDFDWLGQLGALWTF